MAAAAHGVLSPRDLCRTPRFHAVDSDQHPNGEILFAWDWTVHPDRAAYSYGLKSFMEFTPRGSWFLLIGIIGHAFIASAVLAATFIITRVVSLDA